MECAIVALVALALACWIYRVWDRPFSIPYENVYDARAVGAFVKRFITHGPFSTSVPELGAPFGAPRLDRPTAGELLQRVGISGFGIFTDRYGVAMNSYFLLTFPFVAVVAHLALRVLRFRFLVAAPIAILYAFVPYHFFHAEGHLTRSMYVSVPIACLLMLSILSFRATFLHDPESEFRGWSHLKTNVRWARVWLLMALSAIVALTETMAMVFTVVAIIASALIVMIRDRSLAVLVPASVAVLTLLMAFAIALLPNFIYRQQHGSNPAALGRIPIEQELYGLKISQMMLPIPQHRLHELRSIQVEANDRTPVRSEGGQQLGLIGALGLLALLYGAVALRQDRRSTRPMSDRQQLLHQTGLLALILILFGTVSGFAMLAGLAGFVQVRTWNRVVIFIAFLALLAVAIGLERGMNWLRDHARAPRLLGSALVVGIVAFGIWDTAVVVRLDQSSQAPVINTTKEFVARLENRLPSGAQIFQLPVIPYPEYRSRLAVHPDYVAYDYEPLLPYLVSDDLRWSYGAVKGRPETDWQGKVDSAQPGPSLAGLRGLGFDGVVVDRREYADSGAAVIENLSKVLGPPDVVSLDDRWQFWDLRQYAEHKGLSSSELRSAARELVGDLVKQLPEPRTSGE